jgi:hypothetical protein
MNGMSSDQNALVQELLGMLGREQEMRLQSEEQHH